MFMAWCFPPHQSAFRGPRFQSISLTTMNTSSFSHPATAGPDTGIANLPDSILFGCRYWLELCIDPLGLPRLVPAAPDFSSQPHSSFLLCMKPTSRVQVAPSRAPPGGELLSVSSAAGIRRFPHQHLGAGNFPLWPVSASPNLALRRIGSNGALQPRAPFAAVRAPLRAYGYSACSVGVGQTHDLAGLVARPWPAWASDSGVRGLVRPLTGGVEPGPR